MIRDAFTRAQGRIRRRGRTTTKAKAANQDVLPPRRDLQLDALVEILEGKRLVHVHCYRADEILMMIRLAEEMGFKVATFQHVLEGYKVAKEIGRARRRRARRSPTGGATRSKRKTRFPATPSMMTNKGVNVSINSDSAEHARRLNTEAAKSVRWGDINDDQAIAMVTLNPAKQLRIDQRVGSLEVGKDADVVIWSHHPLSTYAIVEQTYIDGIAVLRPRRRSWRGSTWSRRKRRRWPGAAARRRAAQARAGSAPPTPGNLFNIESQPIDVKLNASGPTWSITNARIVPVTRPGHREGHDRHSRQPDPGDRRQRLARPARKIVDARGASVYPGFIDAATDLGINRAGRPRLRRRERDAGLQPDAAHARRVSVRQRRDSGRARRRHHDARRSSWRGGVDHR